MIVLQHYDGKRHRRDDVVCAVAEEQVVALSAVDVCHDNIKDPRVRPTGLAHGRRDAPIISTSRQKSPWSRTGPRIGHAPSPERSRALRVQVCDRFRKSCSVRPGSGRNRSPVSAKSRIRSSRKVRKSDPELAPGREHPDRAEVGERQRPHRALAALRQHVGVAEEDLDPLPHRPAQLGEVEADRLGEVHRRRHQRGVLHEAAQPLGQHRLDLGERVGGRLGQLVVGPAADDPQARAPAPRSRSP